MSDERRIWIDAERCTGCGACVEVCPVGAIALAGEKARLDEEVCTGCGTCVHVCPEGAIQPVIQGELVPTPERPAPAVYRPGPLAETAGTAIAIAGTRLLAQAARVLARAVGRWLTQGSAATRPSTGVAPGARDGAGGARRTRHRWRGG